MNDKNLAVLTNIIGAVESGGQVYGKRRYDQYSPPYHSTPKEHTITIGWYCAYGHEARTLLQGIFDADPSTFKYLDTCSPSIQSMLTKDWEAIRWKPSDRQKLTIINIIDSSVGHKVQDQIFADKMQKLAADCATDYTSDIKAQMMYCEIRHLGGRKPVNRIFDRCNGKFDLDTIMASLARDQKDTSSSNQVGDKIFWSRHVKCRQWVDQYAVEESTSMKYDPQKVINVAMGEVGYKEKNTNIVKYWDVMRPDYQGSAWCDCFVGWCFVQAYGKAAAEYLQCGGTYSFYTPTSASYYKKKNQWFSKPKVGDQAFFKNSQRICHTGLVYAVENGRVYTVEGNADNAVRKKSYSLSDSYIAGFGRPDYGMEASGGSEVNPASVALFQRFLNNNYSRILETAGVGKLTVDGDYGPKTRAAALAVWKYMANKYYDADLTLDNHNFYGACKVAAEKMTDSEIKKHYTLQEILNGLLAGHGYRTLLEFQRSKNIGSGKMNAHTWHMLFNL